MFAPRLKPGDEIRIIAPSTSMAMIKGKQIELARERFNKLGISISFGKNVEVHDEFFISSIEERLEDFHEAFRDQNVKGISTAVGGYNSNQLLKYLDYDLIKANPKVFCGFGDITALSLAIYQKTGLVTYSGPHFSSFGCVYNFDYTLQSFLNAVTNDSPYEINPSNIWNDDLWHLEQEERTFVEQTHYHVIREGKANGKLIGGNLATLNLLQGTEYFPSLENTILFLEEDLESHPHVFDRHLQSLLHLPESRGIRAILIGRFQKESNMTEAALERIIRSKRELEGIPVIANVNIGHVSPMVTIPIGAISSIKAVGNETEIEVEQSE